MYVIMGELSLDGLQPIRGALPIAIKAKEEGFKGFLPKQNVKEAAIVTGLDVYGVFRRLSIS
jgi:magnesium chelatase family protein